MPIFTVLSEKLIINLDQDIAAEMLTKIRSREGKGGVAGDF